MCVCAGRLASIQWQPVTDTRELADGLRLRIKHPEVCFATIKMLVQFLEFRKFSIYSLCFYLYSILLIRNGLIRKLLGNFVSSTDRVLNLFGLKVVMGWWYYGSHGLKVVIATILKFLSRLFQNSSVKEEKKRTTKKILEWNQLKYVYIFSSL